MNELVFAVIQEADSGFVAEALGEDIVTEGDTWNELRTNVQDAVRGFYFDSQPPAYIRPHLTKDELLAVA